MLVLVGGHESGGAEALQPLAASGHAFRAVGVGRDLVRAVADALAAVPGGPVCVVPMTLGRDPRLVADTARGLRWLAGPATVGRVALTEPFGSAGHLVGWLRAAAGRAAASAVLVTARAAGPFEDAELFRIARLVRQYGAHRWVEVAFTGGDPDVDEGVDRCRRLGATEVLLVPAGFGPAAPASTSVAGAVDGGPLLSPHAVAGVLAARAHEALRRLRDGDDGIAAGLDAEHGHGYAHSHASVTEATPAATDPHPHPHPHLHRHVRHHAHH
ncbi:sirohydrochlorin cobaltochelatase [Streptacidiphilus sp. MAP12-20]|uniref:cobalamin biosynthesis protein CbiX n=1 Tax=Streptacidiphilus sp. MAP12-20 TaxID=3156299 RepID=UPI003512BAF0